MTEYPNDDRLERYDKEHAKAIQPYDGETTVPDDGGQPSSSSPSVASEATPADEKPSCPALEAQLEELNAGIRTVKIILGFLVLAWLVETVLLFFK